MYINTQTLDKATLRDIRQAHPNVSLPRQPTDSHLAPLGYAVLHPTERPAGDVVTEGAPEQRAGGSWYQAWDVRDFTPEEATEALEREKQRATRRVNDGYNAESESLVKSYPEREIATFDKQESEARAWLADNTVDTPFLDGLLMTRSIGKTDLANRVLAKAGGFSAAAGQLTGKRQTLEAAIEAASTIAEVEVIEW